MARDVDRVIDFIRSRDEIPPVHRQVMIDRVEGSGPPSDAELERAAAKVHGSACRCGLPRSSPVHGNPFNAGHTYEAV